MCKIGDNNNINSQSSETTIYAVHITRNKKIIFKFKMKPPADTDLNAQIIFFLNPFSGRLPDSYTRKTKTTVKFLFVKKKIIKFCLTIIIRYYKKGKWETSIL